MTRAVFRWPLCPGAAPWFAPLHPRGCVEVACHGPCKPPPRHRGAGPSPADAGRLYRVVVRGNDDSGMARDLLTAEEADALLAGLPNPLRLDWLRSRGFRAG